MIKRRIVLLQSLGCFALLLASYPPAALLDALLGHPPPYGALHGLLLALTGLSGGLLAKFMRSRIPIPAFRILFSAAAFVPLSLAPLLLLPQAPWYEILLSCAGQAALFFTGLHLSRKGYDEFGTSPQWLGLLIEAAVGLFLLWAVREHCAYPYEPMLSVIFLLSSFALLALVRNQSNIDTLTASRHYSLESLPAQIRKRNLLLLGLVLAVTVLLFFGLNTLAPGLAAGMAVLWGWLRTWIRRLLSGRSKPEAGELPPEEMPGQPEQFPNGPDTGNAWIGQIIQWGVLLLLVIAVSAVLYSNRGPILRALRRLVQMLTDWMRRLFSRLPGHLEGDAGEYVDQSESVAASSARPSRSTGRERRAWGKAYRRYRHMGTGDGRFRIGYLLAAQGARLCGIGIVPSDTPCEIAGKAEPVTGGSYQAATQEYNELYYGAREYAPHSQAELDEALARIAGRLRIKT